MATYKEIQDYIKVKYGFVAQSCWIAHMKELCGLPVKQSYNRICLSSRKKPCPPERETAIKEAFIHFGML